jgi:hypothetical protein
LGRGGRNTEQLRQITTKTETKFRDLYVFVQKPFEEYISVYNAGARSVCIYACPIYKKHIELIGFSGEGASGSAYVLYMWGDHMHGCLIITSM